MRVDFEGLVRNPRPFVDVGWEGGAGKEKLGRQESEVEEEDREVDGREDMEDMELL